MELIKVKDIVRVCDGNLIYGDSEIICENFSTDTRKIEENDVYIGLKGENFNGSNFYIDALEKGARVCIVQEVEVSKELEGRFENTAVIVVENTLVALQEIARYKRSLYNIPVIAVTGSVGKTSTKDIISSVVATEFNVLKTEGNFNNHIGLPLTILKLRDHNALVVEMGMNNLGEISLLTNIAKPDIAIITNVGTAHIGNLGSRENILKAKLEILEGLSKNGVLVFNNDNDMLFNWNENVRMSNVFNFGINNISNVMAENINYHAENTDFEIKYNNDIIKVEVEVPGEVFVYNSLCAFCVGNLLKIKNENIIRGIKTFELTKNRMEVKKYKNLTVISDCYNANFDSMKSGLENLSRMECKRKIAILGDMLELGEFSKKLHLDVGIEVAKNNIDLLLTVGKEALFINQAAIEHGMVENNVKHFNTNQELIENLKNIISDGDFILVKASNGMKFKEIVEFFDKKYL